MESRKGKKKYTSHSWEKYMACYWKSILQKPKNIMKQKFFFSFIRAFGMGTHIQKVLLYTFRLKPYKHHTEKKNNKRKKGRNFFFSSVTSSRTCVRYHLVIVLHICAVCVRWRQRVKAFWWFKGFSETVSSSWNCILQIFQNIHTHTHTIKSNLFFSYMKLIANENLMNLHRF